MHNILIVLVLIIAFIGGCNSNPSAYVNKLDRSEALYRAQVNIMDRIFTSYNKMYLIGKKSYDSMRPISTKELRAIDTIYSQILEQKSSLITSRDVLKDLWKGSNLNPGGSIYRAQERVVNMILSEYEAVYKIATKSYLASRTLTSEEIVNVKIKLGKVKALKNGLKASYEKLREIWINLYTKQKSTIHLNLQLGELALRILTNVIAPK